MWYGYESQATHAADEALYHSARLHLGMHSDTIAVCGVDTEPAVDCARSTTGVADRDTLDYRLDNPCPKMEGAP